MVYDGLTVGQNVRIMREQNHWTIEQLSEAVDKSVSHIVQMELGSRKMSLDLLFSLMTVFNVDANSILGVSNNEELSIDKALNKLNEPQKQYLTNIFMDMIKKIPA